MIPRYFEGTLLYNRNLFLLFVLLKGRLKLEGMDLKFLLSLPSLMERQDLQLYYYLHNLESRVLDLRIINHLKHFN